MSSPRAAARCNGGNCALFIKILIRPSLFEIFFVLFARQVSLFDPLKRFIGCTQASLQLSRLDSLEDLAEFRAGPKPERDQIVTAQQCRRHDRVPSEALSFSPH